MAVVIGTVGIQQARLGSIGIREIYSGEAKVYERTGGVFFLELYSEVEENPEPPVEPTPEEPTPEEPEPEEPVPEEPEPEEPTPEEPTD